ncbi:MULTISPECIES: universal stress protein [Paenibacillus]|uniref:Universal stress protein n=1 Tax=Paenibacillus radicis (ex Xue et al. 2023) TaxID=2972489 RepID=A0ABT1YN27_9BACL|nr:universal stress protein [Paenibacillus radicis (ex Xue et al. 2023)]MCR8633405.1 universal stress protein [Paenibacillus radicis (ex Xue et al. 2023)]
MFNKILVAYDGSETAQNALHKAIEMKMTLKDSYLEVVHVFQVASAVLGDALLTAPVMVQDDLYEAAETLTSEVRQQIAHLPFAAATLLDGGPPAKVILDYAEEHQFDLIISGSRGLGTFKELLLGSVSYEIVQHAKIPVLIVK